MHTHKHTEVKVVLVFLSFNLFSRICLIKSICGLKSVNYKDVCSCFMEKSCVCDFDGNRYTCRRLVFSGGGGGGGLLVFLFCMYIYARFFYIQIWCENKFILLKELMNVNLYKGNQNVENESKQKKALRNFNIES